MCEGFFHGRDDISKMADILAMIDRSVDEYLISQNARMCVWWGGASAALPPHVYSFICRDVWVGARTYSTQRTCASAYVQTAKKSRSVLYTTLRAT